MRDFYFFSLLISVFALNILPLHLKVAIVIFSFCVFAAMKKKNKAKTFLFACSASAVSYLVIFPFSGSALGFSLTVLGSILLSVSAFNIYDRSFVKDLLFSRPGSKWLTMLGLFFIFFSDHVPRNFGKRRKYDIKDFDEAFRNFTDEVLAKGFDVRPLNINAGKTVFSLFAALVLNLGFYYAISELSGRAFL